MKHYRLLIFFSSFLNEYKRFLIIPILFALILALQESIGPYIIKIIIDGIPNAQKNNDWSSIFWLGAFYVISVEIVNILFRLRDYFKLKVFPSVKSKIVDHMYDCLLNYNYSFHINQTSGALTNKISDMIKGVESIFNMIVDVFLWRTLSLIFATITMYLAQPLISIVLIFWCVLFVKMTLVLSKKTHELAVCFTASRNDLFGKIADGLTNILNIILYNNQIAESKSLSKNLKQHQIKENTLLKKMLTIGFYQGFMVTLLTAIVTGLLIYGCKSNHLTVGQFSLVMILSGTIIRNVYSISSDLVQFSKELGACTEAMSIIEPTDQPSCPQPLEDFKILNGAVDYDDVSFAYDKSKAVLEALSLNIAAKEKIGLVGISGGGKTTLISMLLRLFDPQKGNIYIDGKNIRDISLNSLRNGISVLPQEPILFNRSIKENIIFGTEEASFEAVIEASKQAHCHEFISNLKDGYDSLVGERGVKLSGGQKQRIALARAFLKNAPIIILDEPTSALDSVTESYIQESLELLLKDKTAIVIAHRISTLKYLDRIVVFHEGKIQGYGAHEQLLQNSKLYQQLYQGQQFIS